MSRDRWSFEQARGNLVAREMSTARKDSLASHLRAVEQAAVPARAVMSDPHWRIYQQMLQGAIERMQKVIDQMAVRLWSPECVEPEQSMLKARINRYAGMLEAWQTAISLPKTLLEDAEAAEAELAKLFPEGADGR